MANLTRMRIEAAAGPSEHTGEAWELRTGDFRVVLADLANQSVDAIVTDPPYDNEGVPLYEPLGAFAASRAEARSPGRRLCRPPPARSRDGTARPRWASPTCGTGRTC